MVSRTSIYSLPDPNMVAEVGFSGTTDVRGYYNQNGAGKTQVHPTDGGFSKTIVLAILGTSNVCNICSTSYSPTHSRGGDGKAVDELCIYNGAVYAQTNPVMGCSFPPQATNGLGNIFTFLASSVIDAAWSVTRIVTINFAIGGSKFSDWASTSGNGLGQNIATAKRRLAAVGLTETAWLFHCGENDTNSVGLASTITNIRNVSSAPIFIPTVSWIAGVTNSNVTSGQAAVINHTNSVWAGPNADSYNSTKRQADNTHFNDSGRISYVTDWITQLHLFGTPFS